MKNNEVLKGSVSFAEYLTRKDKWPQTELSEDGSIKKVDYIIGGSLAPKLLSQSKSRISACFVEENGTLVPQHDIIISEKARRILEKFDQPCGDFDYVPMPHYSSNPNRLRKGGGGPSFEEIPKDALKALKKDRNQIKLMCDPVVTYGPKTVYVVEIEGRKYVVASLESLLSHKVLHIIDTYSLCAQNNEKLEKMNADFEKYFEAAKLVSNNSIDGLVKAACKTVESRDSSLSTNGEARGQKTIEIITQSHGYTSSIKEFFNGMLKMGINVNKPIERKETAAKDMGDISQRMIQDWFEEDGLTKIYIKL